MRRTHPNPIETVDPQPYIERYEQAKDRDDFAGMEQVLLDFVDATEEAAGVGGGGVAPWPYERLAILYRSKKDYRREVDILERFADQTHAPGRKPEKLLTRLSRARDLLEESEDTA